MSITIEITKSDSEVLFGIPEYLTVTASEVSNIYYTLDDSTPDSSSLLVSGKVYLPKLKGVVFKCIAFDGESYSEVFEVSYHVKSDKLFMSRQGENLGVNVIEPDDSRVTLYVASPLYSPAYSKLAIINVPA